MKAQSQLMHQRHKLYSISWLILSVWFKTNFDIAAHQPNDLSK